eukprot:TRINITY_DN13605_c0_g1_i1.p1 TRINITY_DN13605_c0_g1~~TRINITY_DN13605_c0_g1_i1.p1  ORF type:complete len:729 (+),score=99.30 TRINITY_DN13605_c0_g1_i1:73-2259(+)
MPPLSFDVRLRSLELQMALQTENAASDRLRSIDLLERLAAVEARFSETEAFGRSSQAPSVDTNISSKLNDPNNTIAMVQTGEVKDDVVSAAAVESEACNEKGADDAANTVAAASKTHTENTVDFAEEEAIDIDVVKYALSESVWDGMLAIHLPTVGRSAAVLLYIALLLNLIVQVSFCVCLMKSDDFNPGPLGTSRFADTSEVMHRWRLTDGHELSNRDRSGRSLVSRVCAGDGGLSIATSQEATLSEIDSYLGIPREALDNKGYVAEGPFLAIVCIFYYCVSVIQDIKNASLFMIALMSLPRARCTQVSVNNGIVAVSWKCLQCNLVLAAIRVVVAMVLLYVGVVWLATTTVIADLILNSAALCFVLELDDLLFHTIVPCAVQDAVSEVAPMKFKRNRWNLEAFFPLFIVLAIPIVVYFTTVEENIRLMMNVKKTMCAGNKDFVGAKAGTRIMNAVQTVPYSDDSLHETYEFRAVNDLIHAGDLTDTSRFEFVRWHHKGEESFQDSLTDDWLSVPTRAACLDFDNAPFTQLLLDEYPFYFQTSRAIVDPDGTKGLSSEFVCSEYKPFCDESTYSIVRWLCPLTCGCDDATSGLLFGRQGPWGGCAFACEAALRQEQNLPCSDLSVTSIAAKDAADTRAWERYWKSYYNLVAERAPSAASILDALIDEKISNGCNGTTVCPVTAADFCNSNDNILVGYGARSMVSFCPETCCRARRNASKSPDCPSAC